METYVRLMELKARYRWGYRSLVAEVSDSIHLRRFCRISLGERVPDESTVRKLTRRVGPETVNELTRSLIETVVREKRFRPRAVRVDSTVVEADVRYPIDADLAWHGVKILAREGRKLATWWARSECGCETIQVDRAQAQSADPHDPPSQRRSQGRGAGVNRADRRAAAEVGHRSAQARRGGQAPGGRTRRGRQAPGGEPDGGARDRCEKVAAQIRQRVAGEPIKDRLVSLADPDARPIRKGKLAKPNEFGYVSQICEVTEHTRRGARGLIVPASTRLGNPAEDTLLPDTISELTRLGIRPTEIALDGGFNVTRPARRSKTTTWTPSGCSSPAANNPAPAHPATPAALPNRRRRPDQSPQTRYEINRSRLKPDDGQQTWTGWAILAYNADTLAVRGR